MDQRLKALLVIGTISVIIYVIILMTSNSESSFLDASGGRDAAKQKLMVIDQTTGEISFVNKSLAGINKNFTDEDVSIKGDIEQLRADVNTIKGELDDFKTPQLKADVGNTQNTMAKLREKLDGAIRHGQGIQIQYHVPGQGAHGTYRMSQNCNSYGMATNNPVKWTKVSDCKLPVSIMSIKRFDGHLNSPGHDNIL